MNPALDKLFELDNVLRHAAAAYAKNTCLDNLNALRASAFAFGSLAVDLGDAIAKNVQIVEVPK